ncbi:low affinity potassium transporter [Lobaria immixta]|nr:low affinity potassium transporter [Lobaria immixta]
MFGPFKESWDWVKANYPGLPFKKGDLNFITIHYLYIIFLSITGSILLYPAGGLHYIDALFFASGSATQSGLNTVDINKLKTYQQVVFYFIAMIANPIFINTFVVFVRLYWFEKRFQHIVTEARNRTRSRNKTEPKDEPDPGRAERGVDGRNIVVLHNGDLEKANGAGRVAEKLVGRDSESPTGSSMSQGELAAEIRDLPGELHPIKSPSFHREVTFADEVESEENPHSPLHRLPQRRSPEQHIEFLQNQRNPKDEETLQIPGPREYDRGQGPVPLTLNTDGAPLSHQITSPVESRGMSSGFPVKRNITIEAPDHPRPRSDTGTFSKLTPRKTTNSDQTKATAATEEGGSPSARLRTRTGTFTSLVGFGTKEREEKDPMPYLSWQPTIGRNSAFVDLTEEQREELGGIEYRSLKTLALVLVSYFVLFHLLGVITLLPWIVRSSTWGSVVDGAGQSRAWWGIFTPASLFNDLGFTLTPDSMNSFQEAVLPLLLGSFLIIVGNTGFPCMLRFVIWVSSILVPPKSGIWEELNFLLDHPRRCFTLLFPTSATWWLFWILVILNGVDLVFFIILDLNDPVVTNINPSGIRVLNGLFQAASTRTAGFATVNLSDLHPGIQVSYLVMMYISVFPIAISVRRTNVYEEKSLGIYGPSSQEEEDEKEPSYVGAHLRRQLSFDLWYIFMGLFIIAIAEGKHLQNTNEYAFTVFSCLFEIVSAYGTVGLSLGYPNINASFSAEFSVVSKLVIIAMQIRGRHRGLPYELDRAILLPSENLHKKEDEDASKRLQRRGSNVSNIELVGSALQRPPTSATRYGESTSPEAETTRAMARSTGREHELGRNDTLERGRSGHVGHSMHVKSALGKMMAEAASHPKMESRSGHVASD